MLAPALGALYVALGALYVARNQSRNQKPDLEKTTRAGARPRNQNGLLGLRRELPGWSQHQNGLLGLRRELPGLEPTPERPPRAT